MLTCSFRIRGLPVLNPRDHPIVERPSQKLFRVSAGGCSGVRCLSSVIRFSHPSYLAKRLYDSILGALRYLDTAQHG